MRTAFQVLDGMFYLLDFLPEFEVELGLRARHDPEFHVVLRSAETDELQYGRADIPKNLTKYEI